MNTTVAIGQEILKQLGYYTGKVDGDAGPKTMEALRLVNGNKGEVPVSEILKKPWSDERKLIAFVQSYATMLDLDAGEIDGLVGPQTLFVVSQLQELDRSGDFPAPWRDDQAAPDDRTKKLITVNPNNWPKMDEVSMTAFYGKVGTSQVTLDLPYPMRIAWDTTSTVGKITCHQKVHDSLGRVLAEGLKQYGNIKTLTELGLDLFGGCLNVRKQRGGTKWSIHAWGAALDIDPLNNQLKWGRDKATLDAPAYDLWWKLWEKEGWVSLGRVKNYDWMHVQAARL